MDILKLTNSKAVRTVLGVTENDIGEANFEESEIETELDLHLDEWLPDHPAILASGKASAATAAEEKALKHLGMYSKYYCADLISRSANFRLAQAQSDGENEFQRYQDNKLDKLVTSIRGKMSHHRTFLTTYAVTAFSTTAETKSYSQFGKATPDYNPVTGEST